MNASCVINSNNRRRLVVPKWHILCILHCLVLPCFAYTLTNYPQMHIANVFPFCNLHMCCILVSEWKLQWIQNTIAHSKLQIIFLFVFVWNCNRAYVLDVNKKQGARGIFRIPKKYEHQSWFGKLYDNIGFTVRYLIQAFWNPSENSVTT